jgi:phosphatidylethanolamine/phosphatidyl-N-methylethanolamine N-methyltransferase
MRVRQFDAFARAFLAGRPGGLVVDIGCGLDTRFDRLDDGQMSWLGLDLPEVISLRRQLLPNAERCKMKMTNRWNQFIYLLWAPVYDATVGQFFLPGRQRAIELINLQPGERVLLVGVGTGADLTLLPQGVSAVGIDISPEMLAKARQKLPLPGLDVTLLQGDAQQLLVEEASYDAVIYNLILSVIPDGAACLRENLRALKPDGRAVVFDKFLPDTSQPSFGRRLLNLGSTLFGTDITRRFSELSGGAGVRVICNEPSLMHGAYRVILIRKA